MYGTNRGISQGYRGSFCLVRRGFLSMEAIDGSLSSFKLPTGKAHAAKPSEGAGPAGPATDYFPSHYENQPKDSEELPAQF